MRADIGALITLDTVFRNPARNIEGDTAFFIAGSALGEGAIYVVNKSRHGQRVAFLSVHDIRDVSDKSRLFAFGCSLICSSLPTLRNFDFSQLSDPCIYSIVVHPDDVFAAFAI